MAEVKEVGAPNNVDADRSSSSASSSSDSGSSSSGMSAIIDHQGRVKLYL